MDALREEGGKLRTIIRNQYLSGPTGKNKLTSRSGELRASIRNEAKIEGRKVRAALFTGDDKAPILHWGGTIKSKGAGPLIFNIGGQWIRKHKVRIPGRQFIRAPVIEQRQRIIKRILDKVMQGYYGSA